MTASPTVGRTTGRMTGLARSVAGRGQRFAVGVQVRARTAWNRGSYVRGLLSIVVPCYNVEDYLDECLISLRFQEYRRVEIIVVDDGSPDRCAQIARAHRRRDPRVRLVQQANAGLSAARNTGAEHARGEFITFIDSDDVVQPAAFSAPIAALRESGSDFAVTHYDRIDKTGRRPADRWIREAHAQRRLNATLDTFPEVMVNAVAWSKTYRREFWDRAQLSFPVGKLYEDQPVSMAAYARASSFDVLPDIGVSWRIRHDRSSISQASNTAANLRAHIEAVRSSLAELSAVGGTAATERRALQILANNMPFFLRHILRGDLEFWHLLGEAVTDLMAVISSDLYDREVASHNKLLYEFVTTDRQDDAREFLVRFGADSRRFPTSVDGDAVYSNLPLSEGLPRRLTRMADSQLGLMARALRVRLDDRSLAVDGWAYIRNIDLATQPFSLTLELVSPGGERVPMSVTPRLEPRADLVGEHWHCDYRRSGFTAEVDISGLELATGPWVVTATVEVAGIRREGPVLDAARGGTARVPRVLVRADGDRVWCDALRRPLTLSDGPAAHPPLEPDPELAASVRSDAAPDLPTSHPETPHVVVVDAWLEEESLVAVAHGVPGSGGWRPIAQFGDRSTVAAVEGHLDRTDDGGARLTLPLQRDHWGRPALALHSGKYAVRLRSATGETVPLVPAADLLDRLPLDHRLSRYFASLEVFPATPPTLAVQLQPPLTEDEWGLRNQRRLREEARVDRAEDDSVFFRSLYGEVANCNGLGVHAELRRRGTHLTLFWSVVDHGVPVPEGGVALLEGSRAWHRALARSRYHMVNVHQLDWFAKPPGQVMIQTMHGYPYKVMGHEWWRKGGFPGPQVANYDRRARDWDYFVSPARYATPLLDAAFLEPARSTAEVLEIGYPRNDLLLSPSAPEIRRRTRELLGADDDRVVVMYAPTFRDYLSTDDMTARRVDFFDAAEAAQQLGDRYLLLLRGHAFNARARDVAATQGNVIDVTDHPDVNELILASDAAVVDYSSLRFDYALTGKPMVFLVPDLEQYERARGGVLPYEPTAPGPHVATTREVVRHLRDMASLRRATSGPIADFRRQYVDLDDGYAAGRLVDAVFVPRGDAPVAPPPA